MASARSAAYGIAVVRLRLFREDAESQRLPKRSHPQRTGPVRRSSYPMSLRPTFPTTRVAFVTTPMCLRGMCGLAVDDELLPR